MAEQLPADEIANKTINHYYVEITDGTGLIRGENKFGMKPLTVIGENNLYMVVDDYTFTTICKEKQSYRESLDVPNISACAKDTCWGSRITYSLYTTKRKRAATIRKEIDEVVRDKFGFYLNGLDLSIIKD
jgi:hypothetical protein